MFCAAIEFFIAVFTSSRRFIIHPLSSFSIKHLQFFLNQVSIAFALGLTVEETDESFRKVLLDRSFDCHTIVEAIYYYCIYHGKLYPDAEKLIPVRSNSLRKPGRRCMMISDASTLYFPQKNHPIPSLTRSISMKRTTPFMS